MTRTGGKVQQVMKVISSQGRLLNRVCHQLAGRLRHPRLGLGLLLSLPVAFHLLVFHDGVLLGVVGGAVAIFLANLVGQLVAGLSRLENIGQGVERAGDSIVAMVGGN